MEHAICRKAKIYAEILGYGTSGDASHLTAPSEDGSGAFRAMQYALNDAGVKCAKQVSYINAHATSTPLGDAIEVNAIGRIFSSSSKYRPWVSSMKGSLGHGQGSAGSIESCLAVMAIHHSVLPPSINLEEPDPLMLDLVRFTPNKPITWSLESDQHKHVLLKNSFGFGGTNASLCIGSFR